MGLFESYDPSQFDELAFPECEMKADARFYRDPRFQVGVMAMLGLIVLAGVAVNDAILLLQTARRLIRQGVERSAAPARASGIRLRPILMTTATTVLALMPLAVGGGEAAQLRGPLALTVIGGIIASTVGSLLVIPCVYLLLDRLRFNRRKNE